MLSREQAQALTRVVHLLRPAWNEEGIYAALAQVKDRPAADVHLAAIRAAVDEKAKTPGVIPTNGPHWNEEQPKERVKPLPPLTPDQVRMRTCDICGGVEGCKPPQHAFVPIVKASERRNPDGAAMVRAEWIALKKAAPVPVVPEMNAHGPDA